MTILTTQTTPFTAALGSVVESPFMHPTGAEAFWQLGTSRAGFFGGSDLSAYAHEAKPTVADPASKPRRRVRLAAKQARPPRGVHR